MFYIINFLLQVVNGGVIDNKTSGGGESSIQPLEPDSETVWVVEISPLGKALIVAGILALIIFLIFKFGFKNEKDNKKN